MKAAVRHVYGSEKDITITELPKPVPGDDEVLVAVRATSLNASDWEALTGRPAYVRMWGLFAPKYQVLGSDIAGVVESVGKDVTAFAPGDEVFGDTLGTWGGLAEYASAPAKCLAKKPSALSFVEAAAVPQAALVAVQGIRDVGAAKPGERVLINGAGGGCGTFAIAVAKSIGAEVTAVDSGRKLELMRSLGADHVIDYAKADFATDDARYDLILDLVGRRSPTTCRRALTAEGRYLVVGANVPLLLRFALFGPLLSLGSRKVGVLMVEANRDLTAVGEMVADGTLPVVLDATFPLDDAAEALRRIGHGESLGKVVVTI